MKHILLTSLIVLQSIFSFGQWTWGINFDDTSYLSRISYDSISNPNCAWMVGTPQKMVFNTAWNGSRALMTDTINAVRPLDTSIVYLYHIRQKQYYHFFAFSFSYQLDGDSTDYGTVEVSPDNGLHWVDILKEASTYNIAFPSGGKPNLSGSTLGWNVFYADMYMWASGFQTTPNPFPNTPLGVFDTIRVRFTYITDSGTTAHDGWIIDDLRFADVFESVAEVENDNLISIYPNPVSTVLGISQRQLSDKPKIQIVNALGQTLYSESGLKNSQIDVAGLPAGIYYLRYSNGKEFALKKFIVQH